MPPNFKMPTLHRPCSRQSTTFPFLSTPSQLPFKIDYFQIYLTDEEIWLLVHWLESVALRCSDISLHFTENYHHGVQAHETTFLFANSEA